MRLLTHLCQTWSTLSTTRVEGLASSASDWGSQRSGIHVRRTCLRRQRIILFIAASMALHGQGEMALSFTETSATVLSQISIQIHGTRIQPAQVHYWRDRRWATEKAQLSSVAQPLTSCVNRQSCSSPPLFLTGVDMAASMSCPRILLCNASSPKTVCITSALDVGSKLACEGNTECCTTASASGCDLRRIASMFGNSNNF